MLRDTEGFNIKSKHNADNHIYTTGSKFTYGITRLKEGKELKSYIVNHLEDTLEVDRVVLTVIPGKFFGQTKMKWEYLNPMDSVVLKSVTGLGEDSTLVWLHPPRSGFPMIYTEAAPFPEVKFPIEQHREWRAGISSIRGYEHIGLMGRVGFEYQVKGKESIHTEFKAYGNSWKYESRGESSIGISTHIYYFDDKDGFVYCEYEFPTEETLILQLKSVVRP